MNEILNKLEDEKEIVEELIKIDNNVMNTNDNFNSYYNSIKELLSAEAKMTLIDKDTVFVTEGDFLITLDLLRRINVAANIVIFINQGYVGMNKWLITKYNEITGVEDVTLDLDISYNKYIDKGYRIVPIGEESLIEQVMEDFYV